MANPSASILYRRIQKGAENIVDFISRMKNTNNVEDKGDDTDVTKNLINMAQIPQQ